MMDCGFLPASSAAVTVVPFFRVFAFCVSFCHCDEFTVCVCVCVHVVCISKGSGHYSTIVNGALCLGVVLAGQPADDARCKT